MCKTLLRAGRGILSKPIVKAILPNPSCPKDPLPMAAKVVRHGLGLREELATVVNDGPDGTPAARSETMQ